MSIYAINLTDFNDRLLMKAMSDIPAGSIVFFEDVDSMNVSKPCVDSETPSAPATHGKGEEKIDRFGVTLPGLLNVMDGFHAPDNVLYMMTTNKLEALDPALLRLGQSITVYFSALRRSCRSSNSTTASFPKQTSWTRAPLLKHIRGTRPWQTSRACCWLWQQSLHNCA